MKQWFLRDWTSSNKALSSLREREQVSPIVASTYSLEGIQAMIQGVEIRMGSLG